MYVKKSINHPLHIVLTLLTVGAWLPVYILVALFRGKEFIPNASNVQVHQNNGPGENAIQQAVEAERQRATAQAHMDQYARDYAAWEADNTQRMIDAAKTPAIEA